MVYFYIEEMRQLEKNFSDRLELVNSFWSEVVNDFDSKFQNDYTLPHWENWGDGFNQGEASEADWIEWGLSLPYQIDFSFEIQNGLSKLDRLYLTELEEYLEEKVCRVLDITEEEIEEFFDKHIAGNSYSGMFRPYHFVAIDPVDSEIYDSVQASSNSWTNCPGFLVWDNGDEGTFDKEELGIDSIIENIGDFTENIKEFDREEWKEKNYKEKYDWVDENIEYDDIEEAGDYLLQDLKEKFVSWVKEKIKEEGYFIKN